MKKIRGLNLGGWLVLEKWMTPELFKGYNAEDEYNLLLELKDKRFDVLKKHRDSFINEEDFKWISEYGINVVRLPIGYWLFEDIFPYKKAKNYVDLAFNWAKKYNLEVLLDIHAAPGCQNGFDNGGLSGICDWTKNDNIDKTLDFIEKLCITYKDEASLFGIEVLNEPRWDIDLEIIRDFYKESYLIIRKYLNDKKAIVFHDAFRLEEWQRFFTENNFKNVYLDTHMYQVFSERDRLRTPNETLEKAGNLRLKELKQIDFANVVVGEWSLGIHQNVKSQLHDKYSLEAFYRAIGNILLKTYEATSGWFFWNYKLSPESTKKNIGWSFRDVVSKGYLPEKI
ncbi:glycoside hydrolase family 5 protein [Candidatus Izemoplasma sp. B36]|uniref:glycoside hydrolase family 5 protein n=1 Tax=Candidatus Izemoplasma sp. B36 TaxID=3242468 RepID=UPI0035567AE3